MCLSQEIVDETCRVLLERRQRITQRYNYTDEEVGQLRGALLAVAELSEPQRVTIVDRDPDDDFIVGTALSAKADYIVTRDNGLLEVGSHEGTKIETPERFIHLVRQGNNS